MTSKATLLSCVLQAVNSIVLASGTLTDCSFAGSTRNPGEALITAATLNNITGCSFTAENAHAIRLTSTGTFSIDSTSFTGYGPNRAQFGTTSGVNGSTEVITTNANHLFETGDEVYYQQEGGSQNVGLTNAVRYFVNDLGDTTLSLHRTKSDAVADRARIDLTAGGSETHSLYSAKAAIFNDSGGAITINVTGAGDTPTVRNSTGSSTTVNNAVNLTVTAKFGSNAVVGARVRIEETDGTLVDEGTTNASGIFTVSFNYQTDLNINYIVRLKGFKNFEGQGAITSSGLDVPAPMAADPTVRLP